MDKKIIVLPDKVSYIIDMLTRAGYEAYAVGGCIRDSIMGRKPKDWDITTSAKPAEVKAVFPNTINTGEKHGTVTVMIGREGFEVTTYRIDGEYEDLRHPKEVTFTPDLLEDLKRRDFTINAMAYNTADGLVDAFDGTGDLDRKIIRCVGDAGQRFKEDALRMMRAVRFAAELGFSVDENTKAAICAQSADLKYISAERVQAELVKILTSDHPEMMRILYETGITAAVLPEFDAMMQTEQKHPHHIYTVGEHTIAALKHIRNDKMLRITMLFHDVAKPLCRTTGKDGFHHFYNHPGIGSRLTKEILRRLKFDNDTIQTVCRLIAGHDENPLLTEKSVRRAMVRIGLEAYPAIFEVKKADVLAQSEYMRSEKLEYLKEYEACYLRIIEKGQCLSLKDLAVTGNDLIALGISPGPYLGKVLSDLLEIVLDDPKKNTKEELLERARAFCE